MTKEHVTTHDHGNGRHTESTTTVYDSGATKEVVRDISDRSLVSIDPVISVTRTDSDGNSKTERYK